MENLFRTSQVRSMDDLPLLPGNTAPHPPRPAPSRASPGSLYCTSSYTGILSILVHLNSSCTLSSCLYPFNSPLPSMSRISLSSLADLSRPLRTLRSTSCLSPYSRAFRSASTLKQPGAPVGESHIAFSAPSLIATPSLSRYLTSSPVPCAPTYFEVVVVPFSFFILDITILVSRPWGTPRPVFLPVSYMIVRGLHLCYRRSRHPPPSFLYDHVPRPASCVIHTPRRLAYFSFSGLVRMSFRPQDYPRLLSPTTRSCQPR